MSLAAQVSPQKPMAQSPTAMSESNSGLDLTSSREGSTASLLSDSSNYMNITNDGLFPGQTMETIQSTQEVSDDITLGYNPKHHPRNPMQGMVMVGNTQSLPNGLPPGSIAKYNMDAVQLSTQQFLVEHLASFPQDPKVGFLTPADALSKLKKISTGGGLWAQKMSMNLSSEKLVMANGETFEIIEEYPVNQISLCITVIDDPMFENLLIFSTKLSQDKVGAVHLFQCKSTEASLISDVINRQREQKARIANGHMNGIPDMVSINSSDHGSESTHQQTRTEYNLQQRHAVARAVEAFQSNPPPQQNASSEPGSTQISSIQDARINRDVEILNKCIEEIENFVVMLKRINEARKQLQVKKRSSKKKKMENILLLQSQPPPDHRIYDIYQKFKHSLNLLGKLQPHITDPNAPELIHYLFIPLGIIVKVTSIERARSVVDPLLTSTAVNLLVNCLDSREYHFWQSLGPNWTLTKASDQFKDRYFNPYIPVFVDGWVPPEIIGNEKQEMVAQTTAAMVARMKVPNGYDHVDTVIVQPQQLTAAAPPPQTKPKPKLVVNTADIHAQPTRTNSYSPRQQTQYRLVGIVVYDYMAHNNKELTIRAGEKVYIIDNTRRWWLVRNEHGEQGYVPSTVLEIPAQESGASSPIDSVNSFSMSPNPHMQNRVSKNTAYSPPYDANQNYVNEDSLKRTSSTGKNISPVMISVQLPDGSRVQSNTDGTHIIASPASMKTNGTHVIASSASMKTNGTHVIANPASMKTEQQRNGSPPYAVVKKKQVTSQNSNGFDGYQASAQVINQNSIVNQARILQQQQQRVSPPKTPAAPPPVFAYPAPPPPPPPPVAPPVVSPKPNSIVLPKEANLQSIGEGDRNSEQTGGDLHHELRNRLTLHQVEVGKAKQSVPDIDSVDVFIPLYKSSTADDVSRWLLKLGFSQRSVDILKGKTALDLFKIKKEDMIDLLGNDDGIQLFEELQVQNGAKNRHKTLTEFQRALVRRVQKREEQQELARGHHGYDSESSSSPSNSMTKEDTKTFDSQSSLVKKQKEELERLKRESREPVNATFSSFSVNAATPQGKTKL